MTGLFIMYIITGLKFLYKFINIGTKLLLLFNNFNFDSCMSLEIFLSTKWNRVEKKPEKEKQKRVGKKGNCILIEENGLKVQLLLKATKAGTENG